MKTNKENFVGKLRKLGIPMPRWSRNIGTIVAITCLFSVTACDKYDLDETDPEGWGASIYYYLEQQGNYSNTLKLIDDLGQKDVLAKTGSKTLFVADDDAFQRFFQNNKWGVTSYSQLSTSQKKLLLYGSMINNSYQINTLSSVYGDNDIIEGVCVRRSTAATIYDSVKVAKTADIIPATESGRNNNPCWSKFADRNEILLMEDMTPTPMVHFVEAYINNNHFQNSDINFLFNGKIDRQPGDATINGVNVIKKNIKCSNGFIHQLAEVALPLDNMANIIAQNPKTSEFSKLMDRFSAPMYVGQTVTERYNLYNGTQYDSIFQKRYFSKQDRHEFKTDDDKKVHADLLNFDPGWNRYYLNDEYSEELAVNRDMAFILAPTNEALQDYWANGAGSILVEQYGSVEDIPNNIIAELVNNNFQASFNAKGVVSKFGSILNDANDPMDVQKEMVDSVMLGCNGVVYALKKVYSPTSFVSVMYPTVVNKNMRILKWAIEQNKYTVYLNSLNSYYSFFIPTNESMLTYVAPWTYNNMQPVVYEFHYDEKLNNPIWAILKPYDLETNTVIGDSIGVERDQNTLKDILKDVLDNCIVVNKNVEDGHEYYQTKIGTALKIGKNAEGKMTVQGSYQVNDGQEPIAINKIYDQSPNKEENKAGNGMCYVLDSTPIMTTTKSVYDVLCEHEEMSAFAELLEGCGLLEDARNDQSSVSSKNLSVMNSYHYTIYVPSNKAIQDLLAKKAIPSLESIQELRDAGNDLQADSEQERLANFVKMHIQDNALYIGAEEMPEEKYETSSVGSNDKFERIFVTLDSDNIYIKMKEDIADNSPEVRKIDKSKGLYNLQAREYFVNNKNKENASKVSTSSSAVIHMLADDKALIK